MLYICGAASIGAVPDDMVIGMGTWLRGGGAGSDMGMWWCSMCVGGLWSSGMGGIAAAMGGGALPSGGLCMGQSVCRLDRVSLARTVHV